MSTIRYDLYFHLCGEVEVDDTEDELEFLDAVFPDGFTGELMGWSEYPKFCSKGYMEVVDDYE